MTFDKQLHGAWLALRFGLGLMAFLAGLDKFFNLLTDWTLYVSPLAERTLPMAPDTFMLVVGVVEMAVGVAILTAWTRLGAYLAAAWLTVIALNLVSTGMFLDLAVRDVVLAISAYTLARMTEALAAETETGTGTMGLGHAHLPLRP